MSNQCLAMLENVLDALSVSRRDKVLDSLDFEFLEGYAPFQQRRQELQEREVMLIEEAIRGHLSHEYLLAELDKVNESSDRNCFDETKFEHNYFRKLLGVEGAWEFITHHFDGVHENVRGQKRAAQYFGDRLVQLNAIVAGKSYEEYLESRRAQTPEVNTDGETE